MFLTDILIIREVAATQLGGNQEGVGVSQNRVWKYSLLNSSQVQFYFRKHPDKHFHICSQRIWFGVQVCCSFCCEKVITKLNQEEITLTSKKTDLLWVTSVLTSLGFQYLLRTQAVLARVFTQAQNIYLSVFGNWGQTGRPNWPLNPRDIMGQVRSEDEDFLIIFLVFVLPARLIKQCSCLTLWNSSESLFPKTFISRTRLENFKWKSQFLTCFVGAFVLANF